MIQFKLTVSTSHYESQPIDLRFVLPMTEEAFQEKTQKFGDKEYFITDVVDAYGLHIDEFTNLKCLNEFANFLNENDIDADTLRAITLVEDTSLDRIQQVLEEETYSIIAAKDVYTDKHADLAWTLYSEGMLDLSLPEDLIDKGYIDWSAIGRDEEINGSWNYSSRFESFIRVW